MKTTLNTGITISQLCDGFVYDEDEGKTNLKSLTED